jgi:hypothetical protein
VFYDWEDLSIAWRSFEEDSRRSRLICRFGNDIILLLFVPIMSPFVLTFLAFLVYLLLEHAELTEPFFFITRQLLIFVFRFRFRGFLFLFFLFLLLLDASDGLLKCFVHDLIIQGQSEDIQLMYL